MTGDFASRPGAALVTGGTGGIGSAVVRMLADRGSKVEFTFRRNAAAARELESACGPGVRGHRLDLSDGARLAGLLEGVGGLHTVVYASGPHVPMVRLSRVSTERLRGQFLDVDGGYGV